MKAIVLIIVSVFVASETYAQSKKTVNAQLKAELLTVQKTADSIEIAFLSESDKYLTIRRSLKESATSLSKEQFRGNLCLSELQVYHAKLEKAGFDANSLVKIDEVKSIPSPDKTTDYKLDPIITQPSTQLVVKPQVSNLDDLKLKDQNTVLTQYIADFRMVNDQNKVVLSETKSRIEACEQLKVQHAALMDQYSAYNKKISEKNTLIMTKYRELEAVRLEKLRIENEKKRLAEEKNKSKSPEVLEKAKAESDEGREVEFGGRDTKNQDNDEFVAPAEDFYPPPPPPPPPAIYDVVDVAAEFPGGADAMKKYLATNLRMPQVAMEMGVNGKCYLKFVVSETGNISNVKVQKGITDCPECDAEAVRVIRSMPDWIPAKIDGKNVNSWYVLPISFKVQ